MKRVFYIALFHEEENRYWVSFPDFPKCFSQGNTLEDCFFECTRSFRVMC